LFSVLARSVFLKSIPPLSLDHDGLLVTAKNFVDPQSLASNLTQEISEWSKYLLNGSTISVVPKMAFYQGKCYEKKDFVIFP
jgi:hypothetical protein